MFSGWYLGLVAFVLTAALQAVATAPVLARELRDCSSAGYQTAPVLAEELHDRAAPATFHNLSGGQSADTGSVALRDPVLQDYILMALESNEGLKQAKLDYAANLAALKQAKGLFFPEVRLDARYTVADGGRIISFPIGDLLNPVYSTLNLLTMSEQFPQVENEEFPFFRPTEHETKARLVQPIFNADLYHNVKLRQQGAEIARIGVERYREELILEVQKAYYNYQKAWQLHALTDTTMALVEENLRVSRALFDNDKVTVDVVYRSQAEISKVEVEQARARNMLESSRAYFNFLLNRDLTAEIRITAASTESVSASGTPAGTSASTAANITGSTPASTAVQPVDSPPRPALSPTLQAATESALSNRQELHQLKAYQQLNERQTALYKGDGLPGIFTVVDYGFQGEEYTFTGDDDFVMASVVLQWTLFQGRSNHQKVQQSRIEGEKLRSMVTEAEQKIRLDVINSYYALQAARETWRSAYTQLQAARRVYALVTRKYEEGQASLLELIDARTGLTSASANVIIARMDFYTGLAEFNFASGQAFEHMEP